METFAKAAGVQFRFWRDGAIPRFHALVMRR
jgi:hypothetical protein